MKYAVRSFIGTRNIQEDCADCIPTENGIFAIVCDGIGSRANGGESSRMAVRLFSEKFRNEFSDNFPQFITRAAEYIDDEVFKTYGDRCGTTAVVAYIENNLLYWLSVGDSRMYIIRNGQMKQITTDHNYRYILDLRLKKNLIDEKTYNKELKNSELLASFIGMGCIDIVDVSLKPIFLKNGDIIILTTDGLYKPLAERKLCDIIVSGDDPDKIADDLISAVKECGGSLDNTTFTLIFF